MKVVSQRMADDCTREFSKGLPNSKTGKGKITTAVGFNARELSKWLQKIEKHTDEVQIRFGIYTPAHASKASEEGRMTVFLCACDEEGNPATDEDGNPLPPVNNGNTYP